MIPQFPEFKKLELADKNEIEVITHEYLPFSDFNFTSMWSWDTQEKMMVSILNNNLVVKFTDYVTTEIFYSFLGKNKPIETTNIILDYITKEKSGDFIKLIPKDIFDKHKEIDIPSNWNIVEDEDNHDYVISLDLLVNFNTAHTKSRRRAVNKFKQDFNTETKILNLNNPETKKAMFEIIEKSHELNSNGHTSKNETTAIWKYLLHNENFKSLTTGIYLNNKLIAFCICELLPYHYAIGHFWRVDGSISTNLYTFLLNETAKELKKLGYYYFNIEQDLGIDNLRQWKKSFGDYNHLKKYHISLKITNS